MGFRKSLTAVVLAAALVLAGTGCSKKISSSDPSNKATVEIVDPMSYAAIDAKMREYTFGLNEYMREHSAEVTQKTADGATLGGVKAKAMAFVLFGTCSSGNTSISIFRGFTTIAVVSA